MTEITPTTFVLSTFVIDVVSDYISRAFQRVELCTKLAKQVVKEYSPLPMDFKPVCFSTMFSQLPVCKNFDTTLAVERTNNSEVYFTKVRFGKLTNETHLFKLVSYSD